jgi:dCMP deaminase
MQRPSWDEYFMDITRLVARRSTCMRRQVGAIMVKEKNILATGYNGTPTGITHCDITGCLREQLKVPSGERHELCRGLHAEQNAIIQAARHGTNIADCTLYCTNSPCIICAKMLINAGVCRIIYLEGYPDQLSMAMLDEAGIESCRFAEVASSGPSR